MKAYKSFKLATSLSAVRLWRLKDEKQTCECFVTPLASSHFQAFLKFRNHSHDFTAHDRCFKADFEIFNIFPAINRTNVYCVTYESGEYVLAVEKAELS